MAGDGRRRVAVGRRLLRPYLKPTEADVSTWTPFALFLMIDAIFTSKPGPESDAFRAEMPPLPPLPEGYDDMTAKVVGGLFCNRFEIDGKPFCSVTQVSSGSTKFDFVFSSPADTPFADLFGALFTLYLGAAAGGMTLADTPEDRKVWGVIERIKVTVEPISPLSTKKRTGWTSRRHQPRVRR